MEGKRCRGRNPERLSEAKPVVGATVSRATGNALSILAPETQWQEGTGTPSFGRKTLQVLNSPV